MIDDLPPDVRALISASRGPLSPDAATVARLHARVHTAVATGGAAAGASVVVAKLAAVAVVAVATAGAIAYLRRSPPPPAEAPTFASVTTSAVAPDDELEIEPWVVTGEREPAPFPSSIDRTARTPIPMAPPAPTAPTVRPAPVPAPTLAREIELVDQASRALSRGDHAGALAAVRTYDTETAGHGQLAEEAAAIALEAACRSKAPDAAARLAAFTLRWPRSAKHPRLAVCHEGDKP